ncbi:hypothetical protein Poli38472_001410 [Pythium oligandrum]|uniref:Rgp1-domain-containing protein n=1 Tax=Pythium oligandrum TaxID=41045 RepID=A0A8K1FQB6_PYTOL|nr:hypothetical protein Poli38472_001410 [Pythium oligandrum]|eukprot:TMW69254.1 hypothetical protein Poli38472_001410 [Pythium oligandrum]
MGSPDAATMAAGLLSAQLSCRYFRPGGIVRGVVQLSTNRLVPDVSTEIAYVVAQVHAHVTVDSNVLTVPVVPLMSPKSASPGERGRIETAHQNTRFWEQTNGGLPDVRNFTGDTGACIYLSAPFALLSDLNIAPISEELAHPDGKNETLRRCRRDFAIPLPEQICPTFRGTSARVIYFLSVAAQGATEGSKPVSIHLPFDVYATEYFFGPQTLGAEDEDAEKALRRPSRTRRSVSVAIVPVGVRKGSEIPFELRPSLMHGRVETEQKQRAQTSIFTIGRDDSHLVRFLLTKQFYHPGEMLLGIFDFSKASIPCYEISATLCMEETLASMSLHPSKVVQSKEVGFFHEYTTSALQTNVRFSIPHDAIPTIKTDLVCFQWLIRFEFTANVTEGEHGPELTKQIFRWQVPIDVRASTARAPTSFANVPHKLFTGASRIVALA